MFNNWEKRSKRRRVNYIMVEMFCHSLFLLLNTPPPSCTETPQLHQPGGPCDVFVIIFWPFSKVTPGSTPFVCPAHSLSFS